jgi:polyisoprenoid-binding protein YceI
MAREILRELDERLTMRDAKAGFVFIGLSILIAVGGLRAHAGGQGEEATIQLNGGTVTFEVSTNVFSTTVRGESNAITGGTRLRDNGSGLRLEQLEAVVPVGSLKTGIKLRDEHMRKYIFETSNGQAPDVRFSADNAECPKNGAGYVCSTSGNLAIRGTARPFTIELKVARNDEGFQVTGDGKLALSAYGIDRPSQFGVRTEDEVKIHLDLKARNVATSTARLR